MAIKVAKKDLSRRNSICTCNKNTVFEIEIVLF
jgi:hypothetical protein